MSDDDDEYSLKLTVRTAWHYYDDQARQEAGNGGTSQCPRDDFTLDARSTIEELRLINTIRTRKFQTQLGRRSLLTGDTNCRAANCRVSRTRTPHRPTSRSTLRSPLRSLWSRVQTLRGPL